MRLLNTPIQIQTLTLQNRLVLPPMATGKSSPDGRATEELCRYYAQQAEEGAVGLIITEHAYVSPEGKASAGQLSISRDEDVEGLQGIAAAVHQYPTRLFAQISHSGGGASREITGCEAVAPSAIRFSKPSATGITFYGDQEEYPLPHALTEEEIHTLVQKFAQAARRAKEAGFDGVEIHSAHGYLLNQFYSPLTNHRTDAYNGQTLSGRIRLHLEILEAVRGVVGPTFPIALRLGACDYLPGGSTVEDSIAAAQAFEEAGLDLLDISGGLCSYTRPGHREPGFFQELTEAIKAKVGLPVILTGGITTAAEAEEQIKKGRADLIGAGRAKLRDSSWARKALSEE